MPLFNRISKINVSVIKTLGSKINVSTRGPTSLLARHVSQTASLHNPIESAQLINEKQLLQVNFTDKKVFYYPWLFLSDNCTCPKCFHVSSQSRLRKLYDLRLDNHIVNVDTEGNSIKCTWKDNHKATFEETWLKERNFSSENIIQRTKVSRENPVFVGADYQLEEDSFHDVLQDDKKLVKLLKTLCEYGVFKLHDAPKEVGQLNKLSEKIGFIRLTHYGNEFTVISKPNANNPAYTTEKLGLHTDLPYYVYPPGVQLLHCIKQYKGNDGGQSHLVDGFFVAHQMKARFPVMHNILSKTYVEFTDIGEDYTKFYKIHHSPIFVHSEDSGKLTRIVYSNQQLSSHLPISIDKVKPLYEAMKTFSDVCYEPANLIQFKLKEGEMLIFDNWRMLHGREGFDPSKGERHLEGCYIDWDEVHSRINVIERFPKC